MTGSREVDLLILLLIALGVATLVFLGAWLKSRGELGRLKKRFSAVISIDDEVRKVRKKHDRIAAEIEKHTCH